MGTLFRKGSSKFDLPMKGEMSDERFVGTYFFILFILGGSCSLAGTWWCKNKKRKKNEEKPQSSK